MAKKSSFGDLDHAAREGLAARIRAMVDASGSQPNAAKLAQLSVRQIAAYVAGESAPPFLPIARLATALGFDLNWVVSGEGEPRKLSLSHEAAAALAADAKRATGAMRISRIVARIAERLRDFYGVDVKSSERIAGALVALLFADVREGDDDELVSLAEDAYRDLAEETSGVEGNELVEPTERRAPTPKLR